MPSSDSYDCLPKEASTPKSQTSVAAACVQHVAANAKAATIAAALPPALPITIPIPISNFAAPNSEPLTRGRDHRMQQAKNDVEGL